MDDQTLHALARQMLADYDARTPGTAFGEGLRLDVADAWRIQGAVANLREQRGERVIGYKIGATTEGNRKMLGLGHPAWGRLWSSELHESGVELPKADFANVAMEAEFAVTLGTDVTTDSTSEEIMQAIEALYPVIEIHNLVLRGEKPHGAELLANNAIHAGVVRGASVADLVPGTETDLHLIYDGEAVDGWQKLSWPDDILSSIGWLAEQQAAEGRMLKAGDLILTGAFGPPIALDDRVKVDVTSSAFGNVSASFV